MALHDLQTAACSNTLLYFGLKLLSQEMVSGDPKPCTISGGLPFLLAQQFIVITPETAIFHLLSPCHAPSLAPGTVTSSPCIYGWPGFTTLPCARGTLPFLKGLFAHPYLPWCFINIPCSPLIQARLFWVESRQQASLSQQIINIRSCLSKGLRAECWISSLDKNATFANQFQVTLDKLHNSVSLMIKQDKNSTFLIMVLGTINKIIYAHKNICIMLDI